MQLPDVVKAPQDATAFDAALPQGGALSLFSCQNGYLSAIVHAGRTQAACTSRRGPAQSKVFQEHRRRGCRAPRSPFLPWPWPLSWLAALLSKQKKLFTLTSRRFRSTCLRPASTSKSWGRADGAQPRPALFLSAIPADGQGHRFQVFALVAATRYGAATETDSSWRISCGTLPLSPCLHLPPSLPAASLLPSRSPLRSRSTCLRPASTNKITARARRAGPAAPVLAARPLSQEVRPC